MDWAAKQAERAWLLEEKVPASAGYREVEPCATEMRARGALAGAG